MVKLEQKTIEEKNKLVTNAIKVLKEEFVGIDNQIDQIINNVRTWYLYPQLQARPVIVNLWGMSGCGKTSLVKRLVQLLDIEKDLIYFNFAAIDEMTAWEVEDAIEEQLSNEKSNRIFVYDEFQYAATINENGNEKERKSGLKPFWELLDTGILTKRNALYKFNNIRKAITYLIKINGQCQMEIVDGEWANQDDCLKNFSRWEINEIGRIFKLKSNKLASDEDKVTVKSLNFYNENGECLTTDEKCIFDDDILYNIISLSSDREGNDILNRFEEHKKICSMQAEELIDYLIQVYENAAKGRRLKFHDSIIFVIGNLDEAYKMTFDVNPDMSPDQFNKLTSEINIVDVKQALQRRFRNEQIARLGNIHLMYPSFSTDSFKKIIDLNLDKYKVKVKELTNLDIEFDKSIKKIIYDEGVFPTHGTRPIFSTIHEVVKSKLPMVIEYMNDNLDSNKIHSITYYYKRNKFVAKYFDENKDVVGTYSISISLRLNDLRKSTNDDLQTLTALHESGHFVVYTKLTGIMPEKLVSKCADTEIGGFLMESSQKKIKSKRQLMNEIMVSLAGYAAEKMCFGDMDRSVGASFDLRNATILAGRMVRQYGMCDQAYISFSYGDTTEDRYTISENEGTYGNVNDQIKNIINQSLLLVNDILEDDDWKCMLKKSTEYLSVNTAMSKAKMKEIYETVPEEKRNKKNIVESGYYKKKIDELLS